ncbi:oligosaccharide flippase family protein [Staphylococcus lugdunensis]|uniref:lipopolysaccharide biosynthesis protein n=1 Tax=Staphylococcus lugdunensis TaxID=28035 RepID=UPI003168A3B2
MKKSKFLNDSLLMIISSGIGQFILIITTPVVSRIYSPSQFGEFTIFSNIAMILISIINARYDLLIINAKNQHKANVLSQISFIISAVIILCLIPISIIFLIIFPQYILDIIFVIITLVLVSFTNIFTNYLNRERNYKALSIINIFRSASMTLIQIGLGVLHFGSLGLIIGFAFSYISGIGIGYRTFKRYFYIITDKQEVRNEFLEHKNQLIYSTPSILLNSLSFSIVIFFLGILYTNEEVGIYGMTIRILGIPVTIISLGLSKIFMQRANDYYLKYGTFRNLLLKFSGALIVLSIALYIPFYLLSENIVNLILGSQWLGTITVMQITIPLFAIRLLVSTVSLSVVVIKKQQIELMLQASFVIGTVITFYISKIASLEFMQFVELNTAVLIASYSLFYVVLYHFSKSKNIQS